VSLSGLPLMPNGKVDRKALPEPRWARRPDTAGSFTAPRTALERELAGIWSEMLGVEPVGAHDNFFDLGGHSLLAMRLVFRLRDVLRVELPLRTIFESPTIADLARAIEHTREKVVNRSADTSEHKAVSEAAGASRHAETLADMLVDTALDPDIAPVEGEVRRAAEPRHIFLTGASGFLGAFLLAELLNQTRARVYCLVRGRNARDARARLRRHLVSCGVWDESMGTRVSVVVGDLAQPRLGLSAEAFEVLARKIDVVYHAGAQVNFVYAYADLKAANVRGTQEVLRLACLHRTKPVHYVSTLSVFSPHGDPSGRAIREDESLDAHLPHLTHGYEQSKWVAEKLVRAAGDRGLPVCIYRPGLIVGHSQTGASNTDDLLSRAIKGCIQLGSIPAGPEVMRPAPVDYVSRAIVSLSRRKQSVGKAFHLVNPVETSLDQIGDWLRFAGYQLRGVPYGAWRDELLQAAARSADNALYPLLPFLGGEDDDSSQLLPSERFDCRHTDEGLKGSGIVCPELDIALMQRYLAYFRSVGFIDAPPAVPRHPEGGARSLIPEVSTIHAAAREN
jgi:thioester reductase-like protein